MRAITKGQSSLNLTRGDLDLIDGITCEGETLNYVPDFACLCKPNHGTFYDDDENYCYSTSKILEFEGKL